MIECASTATFVPQSDAALIVKPGPPPSKAQQSPEQPAAAAANGDAEAIDRADDSSDETEMNAADARQKKAQQQTQTSLFRGITPAGQRLVAHPVRMLLYNVQLYMTSTSISARVTSGCLLFTCTACVCFCLLIDGGRCTARTPVHYDVLQRSAHCHQSHPAHE